MSRCYVRHTRENWFEGSRFLRRTFWKSVSGGIESDSWLGLVIIWFELLLQELINRCYLLPGLFETMMEHCDIYPHIERCPVLIKIINSRCVGNILWKCFVEKLNGFGRCIIWRKVYNLSNDSAKRISFFIIINKRNHKLSFSFV